MILVLDPKASGALALSGYATITEAGSVVVDSNSATALVASGYARVTASSIRVVGSFVKSGNTVVLNPAPIIHSTALADPLSGLAAPAAPAAGKSLGAVSLGGSSSLTINPGLYSQINVYGNAHLTFNPGTYEIAGGGFLVSGSAHVTLNPGTYEIAGGGFIVSGNAVVSGSGVLIYNAGSSFPKAGGSFGGVNFSGTSSVNLTGPATGPYAGIVIFQSRDNTTTLELSVSALLGTGLVYAPSAVLYLAGSSNLAGPLIVDQLWLTGNADPSPVLPERTSLSGTISPAASISAAPLTFSPASGSILSPHQGKTPAGWTSGSYLDGPGGPSYATYLAAGVMTAPVTSRSEPLSGGATGRFDTTLLSAHGSLFDDSRPGDEMEPWWPQRAGDSLAPQPEPALAPVLGELAEESLVALRTPVGGVGQAAAVDAAIAALEPTSAESSESVPRASSANSLESRAVDRVVAWFTGLTLFGWHGGRTGRDEQDDRRPAVAVRLRPSSRSR
jgi:hypothetical protein